MADLNSLRIVPGIYGYIFSQLESSFGFPSRSKIRRTQALGLAPTKWSYLSHSVLIRFSLIVLSACLNQAARGASGQNCGRWSEPVAMMMRNRVGEIGGALYRLKVISVPRNHSSSRVTNVAKPRKRRQLGMDWLYFA
jgi:hypothetical protein